MSQVADGRLTGRDVVSWSNTLLGAGALVFCLPALFGCLGTFVPELLQPGNSWAMETAWQRLMVNVYTWSVMLAIMSPPATVVGLIVGIVAIKRAGRRTVFGRTVGGILVVTLLLSLFFAGHMLWTVKHTKYPRAPVAEGTGLPNKRMQLTKLRAAPVWQAEVPPCAPAGQMDGGTASQLIRSVRPTVAMQRTEAAPGGTTAREAFHTDGAAAAPQNLSVLPSTAYGSAVAGVAWVTSCPAADGNGQVRLAFVLAQANGRPPTTTSPSGAPQPCRP